MVASEQTLPNNAAKAAGPPTTTQRQYSPMPSVFRAIEYEDCPKCNGSITIIDHDVDRKRAASYRPQAEPYVSQPETAAG